jgi:hypothetical protein
LMVVVTIVRVLVMSAHCGYKTMYRLRKRTIVEREQIFPLCSIYTFLRQ